MRRSRMALVMAAAVLVGIVSVMAIASASARQRLIRVVSIVEEVVPRFVDLEVAVPHLSPAVW